MCSLWKALETMRDGDTSVDLAHLAGRFSSTKVAYQVLWPSYFSSLSELQNCAGWDVMEITSSIGSQAWSVDIRLGLLEICEGERQSSVLFNPTEWHIFRRAKCRTIDCLRRFRSGKGTRALEPIFPDNVLPLPDTLFTLARTKHFSSSPSTICITSARTAKTKLISFKQIHRN